MADQIYNQSGGLGGKFRLVTLPGVQLQFLGRPGCTSILVTVAVTPFCLLLCKYSVIYFTTVEYFSIYVAIGNNVLDKVPLRHCTSGGAGCPVVP